MSNLNNEILLENLFEDALEMGLSEEAAEEWALEQFEDTPNPWDQATLKFQGKIGSCSEISRPFKKMIFFTLGVDFKQINPYTKHS